NDGRALFEVLSDQLQSSDSISVSPRELVPLVRSALDLPLDPRGPDGGPRAADIGNLLKRYGFTKAGRTRQGVTYTVTREMFTERARRYGYPVPGFETPAPV